MTTEVLVALVGLGGVALGSFSTLALTYLNRKFDDRRHLREVALKTAFDCWDRERELSKYIREQTGRGARLAPLDSYIIHYLHLAELISSRRITESNVAQELERIRAISHIAATTARKQDGT